MGKWYDIFRWPWFRRQHSEGPAYIEVTPAKSDDAASGGPTWLARLRKGSKRDQQLAALQAGYADLIELIRAIRQHLEEQAEGRDKLLNHLERHDERLIQSMNRFNQTLEVMDRTSRNSAETMSRLADRTRESEELLSTMLERSERRLVALITLLVVMTVAVIGAGVCFTMAGRARSRPPATADSAAAAPRSIAGLPGGEPAEAAPEEVREQPPAGDEEAPVPTDKEWEAWRKGEKKRRGFLFFRSAK